MSHPIVSNDEIAALLEVFAEQAPADTGKPQPVKDAGKAFADERTTVEPLHGLGAIQARFELNLVAALSELTDQSAKVSIRSSITPSFARWVGTLIQPVQVHWLNFPPSTSSCLIMFDPGWLHRYVDLLFGGSGSAKEPPMGGGFSLIEQRVIQRLALTMAREFAHALPGMHLHEPVWCKAMSALGPAGMMAPGERVLVNDLALEVGAVAGTAWLVSPAAGTPHDAAGDGDSPASH